ncbi:MAG: amino acid permease [Gemmatimonadales bacterium]
MSNELTRTLTAKDAFIAIQDHHRLRDLSGPGTVLTSANAGSASLSVWASAGCWSLLGALTYAELGCMRTGTGGLYAYLRDAFFGPVVAFATAGPCSS